MKAVVIGGAGFIGRALAEKLVLGGHSVIAMDCVGNLSFESIAVTKLDVIRDTIPIEAGVDAVFYLAQSPHYRDFPARADHLFGVNTLGAIRAVQVCQEKGVRFFCYASTGNVYAPSFENLREGCPVRRDEPYSLSKVLAEEALSLFREYINVVSVRLFGVFGPGQQKMLPTLLYDNVLNGRPIYLDRAPAEPGEPEGLRVSYCYLDDVTDQLTALAESAISGRDVPSVLNIAGREAISIRRFAEEVGRLLHKEPVFITTGKERSFDLAADIELLCSALNPSFTAFANAIALSYEDHGDTS